MRGVAPIRSASIGQLAEDAGHGEPWVCWALSQLVEAGGLIRTGRGRFDISRVSAGVDRSLRGRYTLR